MANFFWKAPIIIFVDFATVDKKIGHNLKVELFYLVGMLRTLSPEDSISAFLRKLLQGGRRVSQAIYKFATKGAGSLNVKDQLSGWGIWRSVNGKTHASGLAAFTPLSCTSAVWGQPCFLAHLVACIPSAPQQSSQGVAASAGSQFWESSFIYRGQKLLMAVSFLVDKYVRKYFHFTPSIWFLS